MAQVGRASISTGEVGGSYYENGKHQDKDDDEDEEEGEIDDGQAKQVAAQYEERQESRSLEQQRRQPVKQQEQEKKQAHHQHRQQQKEQHPVASSSSLATTVNTRPLMMLDSGGVYIPPAKRRQLEQQRLQQEQEAAALAASGAGGEGPDKAPDSGIVTAAAARSSASSSSSLARQRETWQDQKRVIHGSINRLNAGTIKQLTQGLFTKVNLIRLRGVLCKSVLQAAVSSPKFSNVYAALISVVNSKLPEVGELCVKRAILAFRRHYKRREKASCQAVCIFLAHLFHQAVVHELIVLQLLSVLLDGNPTDDSVEVAIQLLQVTGQALLEVSPAGVRACLERLRSLLHEGHLNARVEYKMEQLLKQRKTGFRDQPPPIEEELDLVERDDQITFEITLDDEDIKKEEHLDVFSVDAEYDETERDWANIQNEILGGGGSDGGSDTDSNDDASSEDGDGDDSENEDDKDEIPDQELAIVPASSKAMTTVIQDLTEEDLIHLRRTIYLTIMSSATFEECTHKLNKIEIPQGREIELINMLIECCSQERTFLRYYGLISARFCILDDRWRDAFMESFTEQYNTIHRLETNKLRNVAKLFAHLLHTDSMPWTVLSIIHLNEDETTSSSRIFIKIVIQEMAEAMGISKLKGRFEVNSKVDPATASWYAGMFPKDNVRNTRYAINFFTSIGLGPLTDDLREYLKNAPKLILAQAQQAALLAAKAQEAASDESSSVSSTSSSSTSSSSSSSSSSSFSTSSSSSSSSYSSSSRSRSSSSGSYSSVRRGRSQRKRGSKRGRGRDYSNSSRSVSSSLSYSSSPSRRGRRGHGNRSTSGTRPKDAVAREKEDRRSNGRSSSPVDAKGKELRSSRDSKTLSRSKSPQGRGEDQHRSSKTGKPSKSVPMVDDRDKRKKEGRSNTRSFSRSMSPRESPSRKGEGETKNAGRRGGKQSRSRSVSPAPKNGGKDVPVKSGRSQSPPPDRKNSRKKAPASRSRSRSESPPVRNKRRRKGRSYSSSPSRSASPSSYKKRRRSSPSSSSSYSRKRGSRDASGDNEKAKSLKRLADRSRSRSVDEENGRGQKSPSKRNDRLSQDSKKQVRVEREKRSDASRSVSDDRAGAKRDMTPEERKQRAPPPAEGSRDSKRSRRRRSYSSSSSRSNSRD
jgi:pre-mRNA-splicing factor CWC22